MAINEKVQEYKKILDLFPNAQEKYQYLIEQAKDNTNFPEELSNELEKSKSNADVLKIGTEWAIEQSKELIDAGVPILHFYTMGKGEAVKNIAREIF